MAPLRTGEALAQDGEMGCPRDGAILEKVVLEGVTIDRCGRCKGQWFDTKELRRVAQERELEKLATRVRDYPEASGFACPRCAGDCIASFVGDVHVDTCTACHGVWLDAGEFEEAKRTIEINRTLRDAGPGFRDFLRRL